MYIFLVAITFFVYTSGPKARPSYKLKKLIMSFWKPRWASNGHPTYEKWWMEVIAYFNHGHSTDYLVCTSKDHVLVCYFLPFSFYFTYFCSLQMLDLVFRRKASFKSTSFPNFSFCFIFWVIAWTVRRLDYVSVAILQIATILRPSIN